MSEELRCPWSINDPFELAYHDGEWCVPSKDDTYLFEMLNLEGAQAGLSWKLILHKRKAYQEAFFHFDIDKCARLTDEDLARIVSEAAIVKNRLKVKAVRTNALATQKSKQNSAHSLIIFGVLQMESELLMNGREWEKCQLRRNYLKK